MSKQAKAKEEQGYRLSGPTCSNCRNFASDMVPIKWMAEKNAQCTARGESPCYDLSWPANQKETNMRCAIGGFAVKKMAHCNRWEAKDE